MNSCILLGTRSSPRASSAEPKYQSSPSCASPNVPLSVHSAHAGFGDSDMQPVSYAVLVLVAWRIASAETAEASCGSRHSSSPPSTPRRCRGCRMGRRHLGSPTGAVRCSRRRSFKTISPSRASSPNSCTAPPRGRHPHRRREPPTARAHRPHPRARPRQRADRAAATAQTTRPAAQKTDRRDMSLDRSTEPKSGDFYFGIDRCHRFTLPSVGWSGVSDLPGATGHQTC